MRGAEVCLSAISLIGFGFFVVASFLVGLRLLGIASRTGKAPELAIGTAFLAGGGVGYGLIVTAYVLHAFSAPVMPIVVLVGNTSASCGAIALALGIWRIFRPADRWPLALTALIVALLSLSFAGRLRNVAVVPAPTFVFWSFTIGSGVSYAWSAFEALRIHARLRRQTQIDLGSAAIAQRFLLWGVAGSAAVGIHICSAANRFVDADTIHPALMIVQAAFGLSAAIGIWLAFFPPRRLRRTALSG
jgi:hypothetical protein